MRKYQYTASIALLLLVSSNVQAASTTQQKAELIGNSTPINLTLNVDQYSDSITKETLDNWVKQSSVFSLSPNIKSEFENTSFCPVDNIFCELTLTKVQRSYFHLSPQATLNTSAVRAHLEDLSRKVNTDPIDAKFKIEEGRVVTFTESKDGVALNIEQSLVEINKKFSENSFKNSQEIKLPFEVKKSDIAYGDINNMGISSLIGQGKSNFKGSTANRTYNIKVAAERFNGQLIKPGEEFSFVKILGDVDAEHGYRQELVIKPGITEAEYGGGVCQVSTTAFRAAIYSGLKITMRRNHAYAVSYYNPAGMDSTVYIPNPDLRFINNTPNYILMQTNIVGTELTFDFYGTNDGRKTTVDGPYITEKQPDGALKATFTQLVLDKDGKEVIKDVFNSSYASPYKYPHLGGPTLSVKPSNWSEEEWKAYKKTLKDMAKASKN
jgi:vancomycin resistance protein YoaR